MAAVSESGSARSADRTQLGRAGDATRTRDRSEATRTALADEMRAATPDEVQAEARALAANDVTDGFDVAVDAPRPVTHTVRPGDTLSHIARDHGVSLSAVIAANPQIRNPNLIHPGDSITIPGQGQTGGPVDLEPVPSSGVLARGARGPEVSQLQERLNELGYGSGPVDGVFGPITQGAVRRFQMQNELNTTGRVDAATAGALRSPEAARYEPAAGTAPNLAVYPPGSPEQVALFEEAARLVGVPESWAADPGLINILRRESGGRVGVPNYTYGARANDPSQWAGVHEELRNGRITARSSATGLGQLLLSNVDRHYPSGRAGIGVPVEEAAGMLSYINERYGHPATAWARYNTVHEGY